MRNKARDRHLTITDELVELYRKAQPAWNARGGNDERRDVIRDFDRAVGRMPWEHSLLSPHRDDDPLRSALLDKVRGDEAKAWRRYAVQWWKRQAVRAALQSKDRD
jgi:hypothetical protein